MSTASRVRAGAFACAAAFLTLTAAAQAATVTQEGTVLVYTASSGERNAVALVSQGRTVLDIAEQTLLPVISRTPACGAASDRSVRCTVSGISRIDVRLGDGNDSFRSFHPIPVVYDGGAGDDVYGAFAPKFGPLFDSPPGFSQVEFRGGSGRDRATYLGVVGAGVIVSKDEQALDGRVLDGRIADRDNIRSDVEVLEGSSLGDALSGGASAETFISTGGADTLAGGAGDDVFDMGSGRDGPTTVQGGAGRDLVSYADRGFRVHVSPDTDNTLDGQSGEGDRIAQSEVIEGGRAPNELVTPANATIGYRLIGGVSDDLLSSGDGKDRLIGGAGDDRFFSGGQADVIEARDGERESLDCGTNGGDRAEIDGNELAVRNCETRLIPLLGVGVPRLTPTLVRARAGRAAQLRVDWTHPVSWRRLDEVRVVFEAGGRAVGRVVVDQETRRVSSRGAVALVRGATRLRARGDSKRVTVRLAVRIDPRYAGRTLVAKLGARDDDGTVQAPRRAGTIRVAG